MARKQTKSQATVDGAVKRYLAGENINKIAKDVGMSRAGLYLWIRRAKSDAAARADAGVVGKSNSEASHVMSELEARALKEENARLKQRLFELMVKHGLL